MQGLSRTTDSSISESIESIVKQSADDLMKINNILEVRVITQDGDDHRLKYQVRLPSGVNPFDGVMDKVLELTNKVIWKLRDTTKEKHYDYIEFVEHFAETKEGVVAERRLSDCS